MQIVIRMLWYQNIIENTAGYAKMTRMINVRASNMVYTRTQKSEG